MAYRPKNLKERLLHRLKIVQGHLKKIAIMVEDDTYCVDIIHQSQAVQNALKEIDHLILENHLKSCVADAVKGDHKDKAVAEVMKIFKKSA